MTTEACPYCRASISEAEPITICSGCGTKHHQDCYEENGGCTIFGCSCAPAEEPKLSVSVPDLAAVETTAAEVSNAAHAGPPPPPPLARRSPPATIAELQQITNSVMPTMFGSFSGFDNMSRPEPEQDRIRSGPPKKRTTFILLGALLGAFGAHNFYAGYHKKAWFQLAITVLTLGLGSPMSWIWAIIDICTVSQDSFGVQFES